MPTAEGAIQLAMEELPITLSGARCLITGYGRVGQALARLLVALGANVTVAARKFSDLARAQTLGCETLEIQHLENAGDFDVIFNTVPVLLFSRDILQRMDRSTLLIDLASNHGGGRAAAQNHLGPVPAGAGSAQKRRIHHQKRHPQHA